MESEALPAITVVLPVFNEQDCLNAVLPELLASCAMFPEYEIIVVNDCSTDRSGEILRAYASRNPRIRILDLSENSGQSAALWAGFQEARFPITVTLDADGQNDPRDIAACVRHMAHTGADVCCGIRIEPSACAGFAGIRSIVPKCGPDAVLLVWSTGGGMVPPAEMEGYLEK